MFENGHERLNISILMLLNLLRYSLYREKNILKKQISI